MINIKKIVYLLFFIFHFSLFVSSVPPLVANSEKFENFNDFTIEQGHTISVNSVAFSPDGRYIIFGLGDNTLIFFQFMQTVIFVYTLYCVRQKYQKKYR